MPGARLAQGIALPRNFPFAWLGDRSSGWDTVGVLVLLEVLDRVEVDSVISSGRILFLNVICKSDVCLHLGGFYAAQGGDEESWTTVLNYASELRNKSTGAKVVLLGDGNVHFSALLDHECSCPCLHCHQRPADRRIQQACERAGFLLRNDSVPTHSSGSVIDVLLSTGDVPCKCYTGHRRVGESDHFPVFAEISGIGLELNHSCHLGRVMWSTETVWQEALEMVQVELDALNDAIRDILVDPVFRPTQFGGSTSKAFRRHVIDAAAWCRDFLYVLTGHCAAAVVVLRVRPSTTPASRPLRPENCSSYLGFKRAVSQFCWVEKQKATRQFLVLRETDPNLAKRWISNAVSSAGDANVLLISDETGQPLPTHEMASAVMRDLQDKVRGSSTGEATESRRSLQEISRIRARGGFLDSTSAQEGTDFLGPSIPEVVIHEVLDSLKSSKRWLHGTAAALKAACPQGRALTLSLFNLALWVGLTSSFWALRLICPIRKSGPAVVRRLANLRPVSFGSDMAQIVDAVWVKQNKSFIEDFCGPGQLGAGVIQHQRHWPLFCYARCGTRKAHQRTWR